MAKRRAKTEKPVPYLARHWVAISVSVAGLVLSVVGGLYAYHYLSQPGRLPLRVVEIKGEFRHLDRASIQRTVEDAIDGGFFTCDMPKLRDAVMDMPWVAEVSIRRAWPDRLQMRVIEEVPLARWGDDALVNTGARVFRPEVTGSYADMVRLDGPDGSAPRVVAFLRQVAGLLEGRPLQLTQIELDERRHWWLHFADGLVVSLGREQVEHRLVQFLRVYPGLVAQPQRRPGRIDMRYTHGFAVRWREHNDSQSKAGVGAPQGNA
ncbi:MAG: cell division protein FtsQ/DivIB [Gammaproteobacteria bacterium]|nr:cell division protein FtsQ/DivIB [Gammaproteobacteria bacterium]